MIFNKHEEYEGKHAFLGASQFHWINWDYDTLVERFNGQYSQLIGTTVHTLAQDCIKGHIKLTEGRAKGLLEMYLFKAYIPKSAYDIDALISNLIPFVNDAIGFRMSSEVVLLYDKLWSFGTTDAISFNEKDKTLRIHDLKTGSTPAHMEQLMIYSALFYLEYNKKPSQCTTELRIYQNGEVITLVADPMEIEKFMDIIVNTVNHIHILEGR